MAGEDISKIWCNPLYGWREMHAGACSRHGRLGLIGMAGGCIHATLSEPAECRWAERAVPMPRLLITKPGLAPELIEAPPFVPDPTDPPHDERTCPSARTSGSACGYYCRFEPRVGPTAAAWVYAQAVGKTALHETGFRAARLRVLAIVPGYHAMSPDLEAMATSLGVPLLGPDEPTERLTDLGLPVGQVQLASAHDPAHCPLCSPQILPDWQSLAAGFAQINLASSQAMAAMGVAPLSAVPKGRPWWQTVLVPALPPTQSRVLVALWLVGALVQVVPMYFQVWAFVNGGHHWSSIAWLLLGLAFFAWNANNARRAWRGR